MNFLAASRTRLVFNHFLVFTLLFSFVVVPGSVQPSPAVHSSYIVQGAGYENLSILVEKFGGKVTSRLDIINGVGAVLPVANVSLLLAEPAVSAITPNGSVEAANGGSGGVGPATDYPEVGGADQVWQSGILGTNVTVAILDSGIGNEQGLVRDINGNKSRIVGWADFVENKKNPTDPNGHGSHVAGIIGNTQKGSDGKWNGVAPGVDLLPVRVLNKEGYGTYEQVIQGIQWVVANKNTYNVRVLNLSLVAPVQSPYWADPLNQAVTHAWAQGITVVAAAGNGGPGPMTIGVPGNNPYVITVGSFTDAYTPLDWGDDYLAVFSAAGPTLDGFVKPDVVAPGAHMVSIMNPGTHISRNFMANRVSSHYFSMAGTSQSAAVVSGIAALILSANPDLNPNQVKYRIANTAFPWVDLETTEALYSVWQQGSGRINAPDAVLAAISGEANYGMDIQADLAGLTYYEGYSYFDEEEGVFKLRDDPNGLGSYNAWGGGYGVWSGGYGVWSGGYGVWSGGYGVWSGGYGVWSGGYGVWSGGYGVWSGGYGVWSGGYGVWSGGYGVWSGGYGVWSGSEPWYGTSIAEEPFVSKYLAGSSPSTSTSYTSISHWVDEP